MWDYYLTMRIGLGCYKMRQVGLNWYWEIQVRTYL